MVDRVVTLDKLLSELGVGTGLQSVTSANLQLQRQ